MVTGGLYRHRIQLVASGGRPDGLESEMMTLADRLLERAPVRIRQTFLCATKRSEREP